MDKYQNDRVAPSRKKELLVSKPAGESDSPSFRITDRIRPIFTTTHRQVDDHGAFAENP